MKRSAFWVLGFALLGGAGFGVALHGTWPVYGFLIALTVAVSSVCALGRAYAASVLLLLGGVAFVVGFLRGDSVDSVLDASLTPYVGQHVVLSGVVADAVEERDGYARVTIEVRGVENGSSFVPIRAAVLASIPAHSTLQRGDVVTVEGRLSVPRPFQTDTGRFFAYDTFLAARSIGYTMSFARVSLEERGTWSVRRMIESWRVWYEQGLARSLLEPYASLASGITVGSRQGIPRELYDVFRDAGLVHIVVLSGYNITVVVSALFYMLARVPRRTKVFMAMGAITLFVLFTGAGAPVVRAAIMVSVALVATLYARPSIAGRALMLAVLAMVFYEPRVLLYDPGFHLSFLATIGILYVSPLVESYLTRVPSWMGLRDIVTTTLATQLAVLPYLVYVMGSVSLVGLVSNVLVLPLIPFAMAVSAITGVYGALLNTGASFVATPAHFSLWYVVAVAEWSARTPWGIITIADVPLLFPLMAYVCGGVVVYHLWCDRVQKVVYNKEHVS